MRLAQLFLPVTDIDRSVAFYRDVLGIPFSFRVEGQPMAFFQAGDVRLYLGRPEGVDAGGPLAYFAVAHLDEAVGRIESAGGEITTRPHLVHRDDRHELWMAAVADPDDTIVMLMEERPIS